MGDRFNLNAGHGHRFQPTQDAELGFRVAQAIEDHDTYQRFDIDGVSCFTKDPAQFAKAQGFPQFVQGPDVAQGAGRFEFDRWQRGIQKVGPAGDFEQAGDDGIKIASDLVKTTQGDQGAMLGFTGIVTKRLDQLKILARPGAGDLEEHASTLLRNEPMSSIALKQHDVPLHDFYRKRPETRMATWGASRKTLFLAANCRTREVRHDDTEGMPCISDFNRNRIFHFGLSFRTIRDNGFFR